MSEPDQNAPGGSKPKPGRPCCAVTPEEIRELRRQGKSWRQIASMLRIGKTTAARYGMLELSQYPEKVSQNCGSDVGDDQHGDEPAQPSSERQHAGEVIEADTPVVSAESPPAIPRFVFRKILPNRNPVGDIRPIDGKPPGRCEKCGSKVWRLMPGGTCVCSVCNPLTGA